MDMIRHMSGGGIPAEKYPIKMFASEMLARATWSEGGDILRQRGRV